MVKATGTNCIYIPLAAEGGLTARHSQRACTVRTSGYSEHVSEPAAEMPISDAREHLADVVNRAVYGGEATYLTRRGRRLALVVSAAQLEADQARARQQAIVETHRQLWERFKDADDATRTMVRDLIDQSVELAEDHADVAVLRASLDDRESGAEPEPWEQVKAELGL
jgi:prevent-host-death family protein